MFHKNILPITSEMKISDIINYNPYLMLMLEHLSINLGVHHKTVEQICNENNISTEVFLTIANLFSDVKHSKKTDYSSNNIRTMIDYLKNSHQYYINEKYPQIKSYINQICQTNDNPEILMLEKFFENYFIEVSEHLDYENLVVFPYVLNLDKKLSQKNYDNSVSSYSVNEYKEHHDDIEEKLTDLKNLLIKYLPLKYDQPLRRKLLFSLFELEYDLNIHSQIEDSILIPLVEKMEQLAKKK